MRDGKGFCAYPWFNLNTTPQGNCKLCCAMADNNLLMRGTAADSARSYQLHRPLAWDMDDLDTIWNGTAMRDARSAMLSGQVLQECRDCRRLESMGLSSPRLEANQRYADWIPEAPTTIAPLPTSLELRLSTRCNLSCVTCWSGSSDTVRREQLEVMARSSLPASNPDHLAMPDWLHRTLDKEIDMSYDLGRDGRYASSPISMDSFARLAPGLRRLYITGGEPTMDSNVPDYLRVLRDSGNTQCHISFTTNCTLWNERLMDLLASFPNIEVQISIDGHEDANDWIRHHSHWLDVMENVERYFSAIGDGRLVFYTVISAVNAFGLAPLLSYLRDTSHRHQRMAVWTPIILQHPLHLRTAVLPLDHRAAEADRLEEAFNSEAWPEHPFYFREGLDRVLHLLRDPLHEVEWLPRLREFMWHTQSVRNSMLKSFADHNKISVSELEGSGFVRPRQWTEVFTELARSLDGESLG